MHNKVKLGNAKRRRRDTERDTIGMLCVLTPTVDCPVGQSPVRLVGQSYILNRERLSLFSLASITSSVAVIPPLRIPW